jgi:hypothetical protein
MEPKPEKAKIKLILSKFSEKTTNKTLMKKLSKITLGTAEKNAVTLIIEPSYTSQSHM